MKKFLAISFVIAVMIVVFILFENMGIWNLVENTPISEEQTTTEDVELTENEHKTEKEKLMDSIDIENGGIPREQPLSIKRIDHDEYIKLLKRILGDFDMNNLEIVGVTARKTGHSNEKNDVYMLAVMYLLVINSNDYDVFVEGIDGKIMNDKLDNPRHVRNIILDDEEFSVEFTSRKTFFDNRPLYLFEIQNGFTYYDIYFSDEMDGKIYVWIQSAWPSIAGSYEDDSEPESLTN